MRTILLHQAQSAVMREHGEMETSPATVSVRSMTSQLSPVASRTTRGREWSLPMTAYTSSSPALATPRADLAGLTFFSKCLGRVTDTFIAAADNVMMMSNHGPQALGTSLGGRGADHVESGEGRSSSELAGVNPRQNKGGASGRSRLRWILATHAISSGERRQ